MAVTTAGQLLPDFTHSVLPDAAPVSRALSMASAAKNRTLPPQLSARLEQDITRTTGAHDVGALRSLEDAVWVQLSALLPAMLHVYLKQLVRQSCSLTDRQLLECDFNFGLPITEEWFTEADKQNVRAVNAAGFSEADARNAVVVTDHGTAEQMVQYLVEDAAGKLAWQGRMKNKLHRDVPASRHHSLVAEALQQREEQTRMRRTSLDDQLSAARAAVFQAQQQQKFLRERLAHARREAEKRLFLEYFRGLLSSGHLSPRKQGVLANARLRSKIDDADFRDVLHRLGVTPEALEALKEATPPALTAGAECSVCFDEVPDQVLLPCHHVVLCQGCAEEHVATGVLDKCPVCATPVQEFKQVFF